MRKVSMSLVMWMMDDVEHPNVSARNTRAGVR